MPVITPERRIVIADAGDAARGPVHDERIGEAGGLTRLGAFVQTLPPGSRSSIKHWHAEEDEMVYVLEGEVTLVEGDTETLLRPGDAATFRAGAPVGHSLENRSDAPTRCLVVGTRAQVETITYPEANRICHRDRTGPGDTWTDLAGNPGPNPYRG